MKTYSKLLETFKFIVLVLISVIPNASSVPLQVCVTKECNEAASLIISNMDTRVDPCDDFYQFTCGRFKPPKTNNGKTWKNVDIFILVEDQVMKQLRNILTRATQNTPLRLAAQYFNICKQDVTSPQDQMKLVHQKMSIFDGWPNAKWTKNHSWIETLQKLRSIGFGGSYMFRLDVDKHPHDHSKMLLQLTLPKFGFDPEKLQKEQSNSDVQDNFNSWLNIARQFNSLSANPVNDKLLRKRLWEYVQFEVELAKIVSSLDAFIKFEIVDVSTVENRYRSIKWSRVFQALAGSVVKISGSDKIVILPEFMVPLNNLLRKKSKKLINEFVIGRAIVSSVRLIDYLQQTPREKFCLLTASEKFTSALASRYIKEYFQEAERNSVEDLAQRVKSELHKSISNSDWLDRRSKIHALEKLDHITVIIGYSNEQLESDSFYNDVYKNYQMNTKNSFESTLSLLKMELDLVFGSLRNESLAKVVDAVNVFEVNGQYMPHENSVFVKAGAVQGMFYSEKRPNYLNYGFIGFVIGHEFSHAFDPRNYKYSRRGKHREWASKNTKKNYNEKKACLIRHYGQYSEKGLRERVNGSRTLDENMSDYEGIKSAYSAYNSWLEGKTEEKLSGLPYNNQQMFWISAATMWCSQFSAQGLAYLLENSVHTPPKARINALLSGMKEFSRDFHCPADSKMNPPTKCQLWR